jgi:hypothetical protein
MILCDVGAAEDGESLSVVAAHGNPLSLACDNDRPAAILKCEKSQPETSPPLKTFAPTLVPPCSPGARGCASAVPGCRQQDEIDLRAIIRPADFPIMGLRAALRCEPMCRGQGPAPKLLGPVGAQ